MSTKLRLARVLRESGAPEEMVRRAVRGAYDDYDSLSATPIMDLVRDCQHHNLTDIAKRAMNGEFDATREEGEAWLTKRPTPFIVRNPSR